jgi:hypothetical protein
MPDPKDMPVIPRGRAERAVGGETMFKRAEQAGVISPHRTPTGREYLTPAEFERLIAFNEEAKVAR